MAEAGPYLVDPAASALETSGVLPYSFTGILLQLIRGQFASVSNILEPQLKQYIWTDDIRKTPIIIIPTWQWTLQSLQKRPAIVIRRNAVQYTRIALGDGAAVVGETDMDKLPVNAPATYSEQAAGSHTIVCISELPAAAELLALEVSSRLRQYQPRIRSELGLNRLHISAVGPVAKLEESSEYFAVEVNVDYVYIEAWELPSDAPYLKRLDYVADH